MVQLYENGSLVDQSGVTFSSYKTYPNAYIVVDGNTQYSKHYYAGTERIVSRIGDQDISYFEPVTPEPGGPITKLKSDSEPEFDAEKLRQAQINDLQNLAKTLNKGKVSFKESKSAQPEETAKNEDGAIERPVPGNIYFFHPDHLGTATYLTDINGNPYQFFLNLPFGETMAEQHSQTEDYENPYKFNGKELDQETGLYYYGARYYDPKISVWMSVDPLMEKYPNANPYNFCLQNPVNLVDPDGRSASPIFDMDGNFLGTDENGYSGTLIFMMKEHYEVLKDVGKSGKMDHQLALSVGSTLSQVIGDSSRETFSDKDINMINNAITHVALQMSSDDVNKNDLYNGKTSSMYNSLYFDKYNNNWVNDRRANDGADMYAALNNTVTNNLDVSVPKGKSKVTFNLYNWQSVGLTVENIQNTMIHELKGHGQKGYSGGTNKEHAKAIDLQKLHPTWRNTTKNFQRHLNGVQEDMLKKP